MGGGEGRLSGKGGMQADVMNGSKGGSSKLMLVGGEGLQAISQDSWGAARERGGLPGV